MTFALILSDYRPRIKRAYMYEMFALLNIEDLESYKIHRHFAKHTPDYLIRIVGEYSEYRKLKPKKIREGKIESCFKKMAAFLHFHLIKKRAKKKSKNKNKHRENAESV
jgi:hypothetical protein